MVCCGYDEESKMLIMQNHWGRSWGLKGFFLCPYDVWSRQCNIFCWYQRKSPSQKRSSSRRKNEEDVQSSDGELLEA